jgi:hypothetical protein
VIRIAFSREKPRRQEGTETAQFCDNSNVMAWIAPDQ